MTLKQAIKQLKQLSYNATLESGEQLLILETNEVFELLDKFTTSQICPQCESINTSCNKENLYTCKDCDTKFVVCWVVDSKNRSSFINAKTEHEAKEIFKDHSKGEEIVNVQKRNVVI